MKNQKTKRRCLRLLALMMAAILMTGSLSGCSMLPFSFIKGDSEQSGSGKEDNDRSSKKKAEYVTDEEYKVTIDGDKYEGSYTGEVENDVPTGEGVFVADDDFTFTGTFDKGKPIDGTLEDFPMTRSVYGQEMKGLYNGPLAEKELTGEGTFTSGDFVYSGYFEYGYFKGSADVTNMPYSMEKFERTLEGIYTGAVEDLRPSGNGKFTFDEASYTGIFKDGLFENGDLSNCSLSIKIGQEHFSGMFSGSVAEGVLSGDGTFTTESMTYEGTFEDDAPTGDGKISGYVYELFFQDYSFIGTYDGQIDAFYPDGDGVFNLPANGDNPYLIYSGTFQDGALKDGSIETNHCTLVFVNTDGTENNRLGSFTGGLQDGLPSGEGTFYAVNNYSEPYILTGTFRNGRAHGDMTQTVLLTEGDLVWTREYVDGDPIFKAAADYCAVLLVQNETNTKLNVSLKTFDLLKKYEADFTGLTNSETLKQLLNKDLTQQKAYADLNTYGGQIGKFENFAIYTVGEVVQLYDDLYVRYLSTLSKDDSQAVIWVGIFGSKEYLESLQYQKDDVLTIWGTPMYIDIRDDNYNYLFVVAFEIDK